ncbi:1,4-dihydroxy-2-naphthoate polyprenyltransferase [Bacteroidota bacterium]
MNKLHIWFHAIRPRTLPLAVSSTLLGSFLAAYNSKFNYRILILSSLTTIFLQILSNLANDYGDSDKGADNDKRIGPKRAIQSGLIRKKNMKAAIFLTVFLSLLCGIWLIFEGTRGINRIYVLLFLLLGFGAIFSAIKYTVGNKPYGYVGLGDLFVFIWFGMVGVSGTYFLHTNTLPMDILLPSASLGLLSVGVLNINNLRDRISDKIAGKITLVVRIGESWGKIYQVILIITAMICTGIYVFLNYNSFLQLAFLVTAPGFFMHAVLIMKVSDPSLFDPFLKKFALSTFFFSLTLGLGFILS